MNKKILCDLLNSVGFDGVSLTKALVRSFGSTSAALEAEENMLFQAMKRQNSFLKLWLTMWQRRSAQWLPYSLTMSMQSY